jgi:uncharacterized membrane protein
MALPLLVRIVRSRPRLFTPFALGVVAAPLLPWPIPAPTRVVIGWDIAVAVFLLLSAEHFIRADHSSIADDAARQEEGDWTLFALVLLGAAMSFVAIVEFSGLSQKKGQNALYLVLVTLTMAASWLMTTSPSPIATRTSSMAATAPAA